MRDGGRDDVPKDAGPQDLPDARAPRFGDRWCVDREYFGGPLGVGDGRILADAGWVRDGRLMARFPTLVIPVHHSAPNNYLAYARIQDAWLVADLREDADGHLRLENGTLAGRWSDDEVLAEVFSLGALGEYCTVSAAARDLAKGLVCSARDLGLVENPDRCKALSVGMGFSAYEIGNQPQATDVRTLQQRCELGYHLPELGDVGDLDAMVPAITCADEAMNPK
ncbi:MAG: hypothetical protein EOO74_12030 [Myxococcales bacterium]|nr:MAG: hypothetical protein EOO74_12030 [Myxococcales bacterium]